MTIRLPYVVVLLALLGPVFAGEPQTGTELTVAAATNLDLKATLSEIFTLPFLVGEGSLVRDNNLQFKVTAELSPVSVLADVETVWTPVAFFQLVAGASLGSGWDIGLAHGLSLNQRSGLHDASITTQPFLATLWKAKLGAALQFDIAAIVPGDWNHVVFRTYHEFYYRGLIGIGDDVSWYFENDYGENRNGWNYYGNYFLGYKMPIFLDTIGMLLENDLYLFTTPGRQAWGDDLMRWNFGPLLDFRLSDRTTLALLVQFWTWRNFVGGTGNYGFYQDRILDTAHPQFITFHRAALFLDVQL